MYQLWLDDLYPRAKFADGLAIIEKLGHTKRVQMMRKEWIDEGKPKHTTREEDEAEIARADEYTQQDGEAMVGVQETAVQNVEDNLPHNGTEATRGATVPPEEPDEDELDALLGEENAPAPPTTTANKATITSAADDDPFADAMEAMADMDDMW